MRRSPSTSQNRTDEPSSSLIRFVSVDRDDEEQPDATARARTTIVPPHRPPEIGSSSSGICALAEMPSALKPIISDSPSATTPRTIGSRSSRWRLSTDSIGNVWTSISPRGGSAASMRTPSSSSCSGAGLRTATAQLRMPRIITPSSTAWPPTGASRVATHWPGASSSAGADGSGGREVVATGIVRS